MRVRFIGSILIVSIVVFTIATPAQAQRRDMDTTTIRGHLMYTLGEPGMIPAIFEPKFVDIEAADSLYHPNEPLLVALGETEVKAYSTWHLDDHEVVNDSLDGEPIAATW